MRSFNSPCRTIRGLPQFGHRWAVDRSGRMQSRQRPGSAATSGGSSGPGMAFSRLRRFAIAYAAHSQPIPATFRHGLQMPVSSAHGRGKNPVRLKGTLWCGRRPSDPEEKRPSTPGNAASAPDRRLGAAVPEWQLLRLLRRLARSSSCSTRCAATRFSPSFAFRQHYSRIRGASAMLRASTVVVGNV